MASHQLSVGLIDAIWSVAHDGRWHTPDDLARGLPFGVDRISEALDFLWRFGFAELSATRGFRMSSTGPSPREVAGIIRRMEDRHY